MPIRKLYGGFGEKVRHRRIELHLSQGTVARQVDLSRASIANIEAGRQSVLLHQVIDIARALDISAELLLPDDDHRFEMSIGGMSDELPSGVQKFIGDLQLEDAGKGKTR